jgi:sugar/nucleoside kinase (ribokinase family)
MSKPEIIGVGSPLVDILIRVDEDFIKSIGGEKGGMVLVDNTTITDILDKYKATYEQAPGGSAANTIRGLARLGIRCGFVGKVGRDSLGHYIEEAFKQIGITPLLKKAQADTGKVLSMITPDGQRTMRTYLGASQELGPADIFPDDFKGAKIVHVEGYLLFNRNLILSVLQAAKEAGAKVSLDLASFEVVNTAKDILPDILRNYVDIVFSNEDEAMAFTGKSELESIEELSGLCGIAVVKVGKDGAYLKISDSVSKVDACKTQVIDTTGAGDLWASGFLYGMLRGFEIPRCGYLGSLLASKVIENIGAFITEKGWAEISESLSKTLNP